MNAAEMHVALLQVKHQPHPNFGICWNAKEAYRRLFGRGWGRVNHWLAEQFMLMGLDHEFPVPPPSGFTGDAGQAYKHFHNMWEGEYGAARMALLDKLIDRAKALAKLEEVK